MKRSRRMTEEAAQDYPRLAAISEPMEGVGAALLRLASHEAKPKKKRGCGAPKFWTLEGYQFVLLLRQIGEDQLRISGATSVTDVAALEAGIRAHNRRELSFEPESKIKTKALKYAKRLAEARQMVAGYEHRALVNNYLFENQQWKLPFHWI